MGSTSPAGKWKKFETDALGNLVKVTEPRPGGGTDYETTYTYSELGQLLTSTMTRPGKGTGNGSSVTQTRTWTYNSDQRLASITHPENGTTTFAYNTDGTLLRKTDAKSQKIEYTYDTEGRVTAARRYNASNVEDTCARVDSYYGSQTFDASFSQNAVGRLAATATGCSSVTPGQVIELYSYTTAGALAKKRLRIVHASRGTIDKDVAYTYGTDGKLATVLYPGATTAYTYTYDLMDRPTKMTGPSTQLGTQTIDHVKDVVYGTMGNVTSMKYLQGEWDDSAMGDGTHFGQNYFQESKTYNALYQLTRQQTSGVGGMAADIEYTFTAPSSTVNTGRLYSRTNHLRGVSGETVAYQYDELNRLTSATSTVGWVQSFDYDGFGNLWSQTMGGSGLSATPMSLNIQMSTNRINSTNWAYDSNGNTTTMPTTGGTATATYDIDNRMTSWAKAGGTDYYAYLADNKRVWKKEPSGAETIYFYGAGGQKLITYSVTVSPYSWSVSSTNIYFGGKLIRANDAAVVHDRLGSVVARSTHGFLPTVTKHDYLPYGEEMGTATAGNVDKFGTYHRDATSGLDYADQRYFSGTLAGRFLTTDPIGSGTNWYAYVGGDPVNFVDPSGLTAIDPGFNCANQNFLFGTADQCFVNPSESGNGDLMCNGNNYADPKCNQIPPGWLNPPPPGWTPPPPIIGGLIPEVSSTFQPLCVPDAGCVLGQSSPPLVDTAPPVEGLIASFLTSMQNVQVPPITVSVTNFANPVRACPECVVGLGTSITFIPPQGTTVGQLGSPTVWDPSNFAISPLNVEAGLGTPGWSGSLTLWNTTSRQTATNVLCGFGSYFTPVLPNQITSMTWTQSGGAVLTGETMTSRGPSLTMGAGYAMCP